MNLTILFIFITRKYHMNHMKYCTMKHFLQKKSVHDFYVMCHKYIDNIRLKKYIYKIILKY